VNLVLGADLLPIVNVNELCGGCSVININNQKYIMFISEVGRETSGTENVNFYQTTGNSIFCGTFGSPVRGLPQRPSRLSPSRHLMTYAR